MVYLHTLKYVLYRSLKTKYEIEVTIDRLTHEELGNSVKETRLDKG
ncbi:hypothetical protein ESP02_24360 [Enterococcus sp. NBRC 3427]|nr:hypothetical protein ESP02_24360 [Enterococcus sp. NBRC 3427]